MSLAGISPPPFTAIDLGTVSLRLYALCLTVAMIVGVVWGRRRYLARAPGDPESLDKTIFAIVISLLVGSRLAYVIGNWTDFIDSPIDALFPWQGGLAIYGGIALASIVGIWCARRYGLDPAGGFDSAAAVLPAASAIGRFGNYFNQEVYGLPTDLPWALEVEPASRIEGFEQFDTFHPTFAYESIADLIVLGMVLWIDRRYRPRNGSLFLVYLIGYGGFRFLIELIRIDTTIRIFGLSRNAYASLAAVLIGTVGLFFWRRPWQRRP